MFGFRKNKKNLSIFISQKKCVGCEFCVSVCRHKVIGMVYKGNEAYATVEYKDRCTMCRACERACLMDAIEIKKQKQETK